MDCLFLARMVTGDRQTFDLSDSRELNTCNIVFFSFLKP